MNRTEKVELAAKLKKKFSEAHVAIFADYKGLTAPEADQLRRLLRAQKAEMVVLKNNVARLVTQEGGLGPEAQELMDAVVGPTCVAFAWGDPVQIAKEMHQFAEQHEVFSLKDSLMGRKKLSVSQVQALAQLPSRPVLLAQLLGTMKAPVSNFVGVLAAVPRSLLTVLTAIEKKKASSE